MRPETKIELAIILAGALAAGSWVGLRMARPRAATPPKATPIAVGRQSIPPQAAPSRPPGPTPKKAVASAPARRPVPAAMTPKPAPKEKEAAEKPAPEPDDLVRARSLIKAGKKYEARALLTKLILAAPEGDRRTRIKQMLDVINAHLFFSRAPSPDCVFYTVKGGDTLAAICKREGKDVYFSGLIMRLNNIHDPRRIRPGQRLKIPRGRFSALVQKKAHRLIVFLNGHYIKEYPVGLGTPQTPTPEGRFVVGSKKVNPDWYAPDGKLYRYGNPRNILGTRWIGFRDTAEYQGYGIHGTSDPSGIGKDVSNGCIRMLNKDVEELFCMLMLGDVVEIR